jgi:prepilin peptidase CpaA
MIIPLSPPQFFSPSPVRQILSNQKSPIFSMRAYLLQALLKAFGALGALIGPYNLLHVFVYMAFYGGGLALLHYLYQQTDIKKTLREGWVSVCASALTKKVEYIMPSSQKNIMRFPYAVAIAFGYYSFVYWGKIL